MKLNLQIKIEGRYLNGKFTDENKQVYLLSATEQEGIFIGQSIGSDGIVKIFQMKFNDDLGKEFKVDTKEKCKHTGYCINGNLSIHGLWMDGKPVQKSI